MVRSSVRSTNSRVTAARKLFFEPEHEREKQVHAPSCLMPKLKADRVLPRMYHALTALNNLYDQDPVAYDQLKCFFNEAMYQDFINPKGADEEMVISRQKKWAGYMKKWMSAGLLDQSHDMVKFVYENSFVATTTNLRVDEQVNFIAFAPTLLKEYSLPPQDTTIIVPGEADSAQVEIDYPAYADSVSKLLTYKQKHPHSFKNVGALFDESAYKKLMQQYSARSKNQKNEWLNLLRSWQRNDLLTDDLRPIRSLELGYAYLTK
ncbi:hypothetical protein Noda2021_05480 [Candidatus Dependentiae bacterium Noda2021]|nr:hypothetical protein Noda2021_05480 [Candidatus Dependentiae bacterium Noda2021]